MSTPRHKLCELLDESEEITDIDTDKERLNENDTPAPTETVVWQFDPAICG